MFWSKAYLHEWPFVMPFNTWGNIFLYDSFILFDHNWVSHDCVIFGHLIHLLLRELVNLIYEPICLATLFYSLIHDGDFAIRCAFAYLLTFATHILFGICILDVIALSHHAYITYVHCVSLCLKICLLYLPFCPQVLSMLASNMCFLPFFHLIISPLLSPHYLSNMLSFVSLNILKWTLHSS